MKVEEFPSAKDGNEGRRCKCCKFIAVYGYYLQVLAAGPWSSQPGQLPSNHFPVQLRLLASFSTNN